MTGFLTSLSVGRKLILISVSLLLPLGVVVWMLLDLLTGTIRGAQLEQEGIAYQRPLEELLKHLGQHQALAHRFLAGETDVEDALRRERTGVGQALAELEAAQVRYGKDLQFTEAALAARERSGALPQTVRGVGSTHPKLGSADQRRAARASAPTVRTMIAHLGETSRLLTDPDLDSFYLIDISLLALPQVQRRVTDLKLGADADAAGVWDQTAAMRRISDAAPLRADLDRIRRDAESAILTDAGSYGVSPTLAANVRPAVAEFTAAAEALIQGLERGAVPEPDALAGFARAGTTAAAPADLEDAAERTRQASFGLWEGVAGELNKLLDTRIAEFRWRRIVGMALTGAVLAFSTILVWRVSLSITRPLRRCVEGLQALADRDLSRTFNLWAGGEPGAIARGLDRAIVNLRELIGKIQHTSVAIMASATEFTANSRQQQRLADEYRHSTNETAVTVTEISTTSHQLVQTMDDVQDQVDRTADLANLGRIGLNEMEHSINELSHLVESLGEQLAGMRQRAENVNLMVTTIIKVADETNLLSINAAIEAEKAGAHGRGFAVVAREIRRLADQTAVATLDIERTVAAMHQSLAAGCTQMDTVLEGVRRGVESVHRVSDHLTKIIESVHDLTPRFQQVHDGMTAQSQGAEQIREAMLRLSDNAQQALHSLQEFNRATGSLRESVQSLSQDVSLFLLPGRTTRLNLRMDLPAPPALPAPELEEGMPDFSTF